MRVGATDAGGFRTCRGTGRPGPITGDPRRPADQPEGGPPGASQEESKAPPDEPTSPWKEGGRGRGSTGRVQKPGAVAGRPVQPVEAQVEPRLLHADPAAPLSRPAAGGGGRAARSGCRRGFNRQ